MTNPDESMENRYDDYSCDFEERKDYRAWKYTRDKKKIDPEVIMVRDMLREMFGAAPAPPPMRNITSIRKLVNKVATKFNLEGSDDEDPKVLRAAWVKVAGDFISTHSNLARLSKGIATVAVMQPSMRYQLEQWKPEFLSLLRAEFGAERVREIRFRIGA